MFQVPVRDKRLLRSLESLDHSQNCFPMYRTIEGVLSAAPIFLVWMYLSWAAVLIGAVITASLSEWRGGGPARQ